MQRYIRFFFSIYLLFIFFTMIGTLSHEGGHFIVARFLGYTPSIHYGYTGIGRNKLNKEIGSFYKRYKTQIAAKKNFPEKSRFDELIRKSHNDHLWISLGGPLQTMLTGTIGLWLVFRRRTIRHYAATNFDWLCLFLSLFWLRQPTNMLFWLIHKSFNLTSRGDETMLDSLLGLPQGSIILTTGLLGLFFSCAAIYFTVPKNQLVAFCASGVIGGISGYILWLKIIGPIVLP